MGALRRTSVVAAVATVVLTSATAASAVVGTTPVAGTLGFVGKVEIGTGEAVRACSAALVAPQWIVTARSCFTSGDRAAALGTPAEETRVTIGGTSVLGVWLAPHPDRAVTLVKLASRVSATPVRIGSTPVAAGDTLQAAGTGRTADQWVHDQIHVADFTVTEASAATLTIEPTGPGAICKGDAGGPALRSTANGPELVAVHHSSWQGGCIGQADEQRRGAIETRTDDLAGWITSTVADVQLYAVRPDGRITYSTVDSASGDRRTTVVSDASIGFTPKAMAALNATTLLVTTSGGALHRVDITANNPRLTFTVTGPIATGYSHELLTYDGDGTLLGIAKHADGRFFLRRYHVSTAKPSRPDHFRNNTLIDYGFGLKTLTATGPDFILGATPTGALRSYEILPAGTWEGNTLATSSTWAAYTHLVSPGGGLYYGRTPSGRLDRYVDPTPYDLSGTGLQSFPNDPVDTAGWDVATMAAVPFTSNPRSTADVSIYGVTAGGNLTYSTIDSATGDRQGTITSAGTLGFTPSALATLNFDTLLAISGSKLYRVDVITTAPTLTFAPPVELAASGWGHRLLAFDGAGSLFGINGNHDLRRYQVTSPKPTIANITGNTFLGTGFTLNTLTVAGPGWLLGTTAAGELISYQENGNNQPIRKSLRTGWRIAGLTSPGGGLYYARFTSGALNRYVDADPFNGVGTDIQSFPNDPVDSTGWNQPLISALPFVA